MSKNNALVLLVLIIAAGVLMRIVPIRGLTSGVPVSYNVGINTAWASQSIFKYGIAEVVPKDQGFLRYFILHFLLYLGRQERIIGLPALLFGIAALPLIFLTARAFFGVSAGLLSAFLLSFSLWHIRHSTYAEGYTLYAFLALLTIFLFHKALTGRGKWVWAGFSASAIMAVYAFYPNLTILIAGAFWFIIYIRKNKKSIFPVLISIFIILIFIAPVLPGLFCIDKFRGQFNDLWQQGWRLSEALSRLTYLFGGINHYLPVAIFLFFLGAGASFFNDSERRYASLLFLSVVVPWLLILACVFIKISVLERYFFLTYPLFLILVAKGILFFNSRAVRSLCILLVNISLLVFFFSCSIPGVGIGSLIPKDYSPENEGFDFLAAYIKEHYRQGDAVVIEQGKGIFALQYYLDKKNIYPVKKIMPLCGSKSYYQYDGLRIKNIFGLIEYDGSPDRLIKIWREYGRLWLVDLGHIRYFYGADRIQGWIDDSYSQKIKFKGGTIYLFDKYNTKNVSTAYGEYKCRNAVCFLDCPKKIVREFWYPFNTMDKPVYVIGNVPGAVAPFPQWSLESQGDLPPQVQHAQLAFKDGRYQECLKGIEGFLSTNPALDSRQKALCYIGLASCLVEESQRASVLKQNYLNRAKAYFEDAAKELKSEDPLNISICSGLGYIYLQLKDEDRAAFYLKKGLQYPLDKYQKELIDIYTNLGCLYSKNEDYKKAIYYFQAASEVPYLSPLEAMNIYRGRLEAMEKDSGKEGHNYWR